jgi:hypothetical protein
MKVIIFSLFLLIASSANCQTLNKQYIDNWLIKCDTAIKINKINLYVIDGYHYFPSDSLKLNNALKLLTHKKLAGINYYKTEEIIPTAEVWGKYVILISTKRNQTNKWKRETLGTVRSKYSQSHFYLNHINADSNEPVLTINDKVIFHADCYKELSKIKLGNIYAINICTHAVPWEYYGQNARNGLIQIWTYPKSKL